MRQKPVDEVIAAAGGVNALSRALGLSHPTIIGWRRRKQIPAERVRAVAEITGIPPEQLRADLFGSAEAA